MNARPDAESQARARRPRLAHFVATVGGLGYAPKAPGTVGSLAAAAVALGSTWMESSHPLAILRMERDASFWTVGLHPSRLDSLLVILFAMVGVWAAGQVAQSTNQKDPQFVVIDEFSGQLLTYFLPFTVLNWKSWLLGFILFRVFDIWKPFPAGRAERLRAGWGIMADDWIAGIYAAMGLWVARALSF